LFIFLNKEQRIEKLANVTFAKKQPILRIYTKTNSDFYRATKFSNICQIINFEKYAVKSHYCPGIYGGK